MKGVILDQIMEGRNRYYSKSQLNREVDGEHLRQNEFQM